MEKNYARYVVRVSTISNGNKRFEIKDNYWDKRHNVFAASDNSLYTRTGKGILKSGNNVYDEDASSLKMLQEISGFAAKAQPGKVYQLSTYDGVFGKIVETKEVPNSWFI